MRRLKLVKALWVLLIFLPAAIWAQGLSPIISTDDLAKSLKDHNAIVIDIRKVEDYKAGHIPGAIGIFYANWAPG